MNTTTQSPEPLEQTKLALTARETQIWALIALGHTSGQIVAKFKISLKTVENHRASLMTKLKTHCIAGLTRAAIAHGIVTTPTLEKDSFCMVDLTGAVGPQRGGRPSPARAN